MMLGKGRGRPGRWTYVHMRMRRSTCFAWMPVVSDQARAGFVLQIVDVARRADPVRPSNGGVLNNSVLVHDLEFERAWGLQLCVPRTTHRERPQFPGHVANMYKKNRR